MKQLRKCDLRPFFYTHTATGFLIQPGVFLCLKFEVGIGLQWSSELRNCQVVSGNVLVKVVKVGLQSDVVVRKEADLTLTLSPREWCLGLGNFP